MFNGGFAEAQQNSADFPEDSLEAFELLIEWIYTGTYEKIDRNLPRKEKSTLLGHRIELYGLAEKICLPSLADYTMTLIISNFKSSKMIPGASIVQRAYELVPQGSLLLSFMALCVHHDAFLKAHYGENDWTGQDKVANLAANQELLRDVMAIVTVNYGSFIRSNHPLKQPVCNFHKHSQKDSCEYDESHYF